MDLERWPDMPSAELEYRAKLVELIYSTERDMLTTFMLEADPTQAGNGHALASYRIREDFKTLLSCDEEKLKALTIPQIRDTALMLFHASPFVEENEGLEK